MIRQLHTRARAVTHKITFYHTCSLSHSHPMTPTWSSSCPMWSTPAHFSLPREARPSSHLPAPRVLETRRATRDPRRRLPESPAGRRRAEAEARWTPEIGRGNLQLHGFRLSQLFLETPRTSSPRRLCAATFFAKLHFPEGPRPASASRRRSRRP